MPTEAQLLCLRTHRNEWDPKSAASEVLDKPLTTLSLYPRIIQRLNTCGIVTVRDLAAKTADELWAIRGIGPVAFFMIRGQLLAFNLTLKGDSYV